MTTLKHRSLTSESLFSSICAVVFFVSVFAAALSS